MSPLGFVQRLPPVGALSHHLDRLRADRVDDVLSSRRGSAREVLDACRALLDGDDPRAARTVHTNASQLLQELRLAPSNGSVLDRGAARFDDALRSDKPEILDLDGVPQGLKDFTMRLLHRFNVTLGSYDAWTRAVLDALGDRDPAHVYDLAAGTGGYARHLAKHPPAGRSLRITSSDLRDDYVAVGRRAAANEGAATVTWEARDALDLRELRERDDVDLFLCTQAVHHLSPGMVVRMISQAIHTAPGGILIIDIYRSAAAALGTVALISASTPWPVLTWDGFQSVRRAYTPAEFTLLARLAGASHVDAKPLGPGWLTLHARGTR